MNSLNHFQNAAVAHHSAASLLQQQLEQAAADAHHHQHHLVANPDDFRLFQHRSGTSSNTIELLPSNAATPAATTQNSSPEAQPSHPAASVSVIHHSAHLLSLPETHHQHHHLLNSIQQQKCGVGTSSSSSVAEPSLPRSDDSGGGGNLSSTERSLNLSLLHNSAVASNSTLGMDCPPIQQFSVNTNPLHHILLESGGSCWNAELYSQLLLLHQLRLHTTMQQLQQHQQLPSISSHSSSQLATAVESAALFGAHPTTHSQNHQNSFSASAEKRQLANRSFQQSSALAGFVLADANSAASKQQQKPSSTIGTSVISHTSSAAKLGRMQPQLSADVAVAEWQRSLYNLLLANSNTTASTATGLGAELATTMNGGGGTRSFLDEDFRLGQSAFTPTFLRHHQQQPNSANASHQFDTTADTSPPQPRQNRRQNSSPSSPMELVVLAPPPPPMSHQQQQKKLLADEDGKSSASQATTTGGGLLLLDDGNNGENRSCLLLEEGGCSSSSAGSSSNHDEPGATDGGEMLHATSQQPVNNNFSIVATPFGGLPAQSQSRNKLGRSYNPGRPLGMLDRQRILALYQRGLKISHIAKVIGVTHSCVSKIMTRYRRTGSIQPRSAQLSRRVSGDDPSPEESSPDTHQQPFELSLPHQNSLHRNPPPPVTHFPTIYDVFKQNHIATTTNSLGLLFDGSSSGNTGALGFHHKALAHTPAESTTLINISSDVGERSHFADVGSGSGGGLHQAATFGNTECANRLMRWGWQAALNAPSSSHKQQQEAMEVCRNFESPLSLMRAIERAEEAKNTEKPSSSASAVFAPTLLKNSASEPNLAKLKPANNHPSSSMPMNNDKHSSVTPILAGAFRSFLDGGSATTSPSSSNGGRGECGSPITTTNQQSGGRHIMNAVESEHFLQCPPSESLAKTQNLCGVNNSKQPTLKTPAMDAFRSVISLVNSGHLQKMQADESDVEMAELELPKERRTWKTLSNNIRDDCCLDATVTRTVRSSTTFNSIMMDTASDSATAPSTHAQNLANSLVTNYSL